MTARATIAMHLMAHLSTPPSGDDLSIPLEVLGRSHAAVALAYTDALMQGLEGEAMTPVEEPEWQFFQWKGTQDVPVPFRAFKGSRRLAWRKRWLDMGSEGHTPDLWESIPILPRGIPHPDCPKAGASAPTPEQVAELVRALEQYLQAGHKEARQIASVRAKAALTPFRKP